MSLTVEVRFKGTRKVYFLWPGEEPLPGVATLYSLAGTHPRPAIDLAAWPAGEFVVEVAPVGEVP